jgi:hypothetical protein
MENQARFDLNAAVENWRNELAAQPNLASDDRRELETHLRDAIAGFQQRGLNDEESFWLARRRVGQPPELGEEFLKADPAKVWRERTFWIALALLIFDLWEITCSIIIGTILRYDHSFFFNPNREMISVMTTILVQLLKVLPVLWFGILFARGRMNQNDLKRFRPFLQSRWHFAAAATALALLMNISQALLFLGPVAPPQEGVYTISRMFMLANNIFVGLNLPMVCIALVTWLFPSQNQKTPKRA